MTLAVSATWTSFRTSATVALACALALALGTPAAQAATPWKLIGPPAPLTSIAFAPAAASARVYAKAAGTWWRSDDHGASWTRGPDAVCDLRVAPADPDTVYSGCGQVSRDGGAHWSSLPRFIGITGSPQIDRSGALYWVEPGTTSLLRCAADGSSCTQTSIPGSAVQVDPASSGLILTGSGNDGLSVSHDGGATWSLHAWPAGTHAATVSFDGQIPGKLLLVGYDDVNAHAYRVSTDAGTSWGPVRSLPLAGDSALVAAGGDGASHRVWLEWGTAAVWTADDGATFHSVTMPMSQGGLTIDPRDGGHVFSGDAQQLWETHDAGATWTRRNSPSFGHLRYENLSGSGTALYATTERLAWFSHDAGQSWALAAGLNTVRVAALQASRDDPRVAYAAGTGAAAGFWQTVDGGQTWAARATPTLAGGLAWDPSIAWIQSGHPDWVFAPSAPAPAVLASHDGGRTWAPEPLAGTCAFAVAWAPGSTTQGMASCGGASLFAIDPVRAPWDQAFDAAQFLIPDQSGGGELITTQPMGSVAAGWAFTTACPPERSSLCSFTPGYASPSHDVWVGGGHVTWVSSANRASGVWAKVDDGRWWRLSPPPGSEAATPDPSSEPQWGPVVALSHSAVIANGLLVPLASPAAAPPLVALQGPSLFCTTTLTADDADLSYAWLRDGAAIAGARTDHPFVPADLGHALTCVVTATNAWGTTRLTSDPYGVPLTAPIAPGAGSSSARARLSLTGLASVGRLLHCGGTVHIDWLRDGHAVARRHARTYAVRAADEGHTLACRTRRADGAFAQSPAVRVPKSHGGRARVIPPTSRSAATS
jgi:hypothetical protein